MKNLKLKSILFCFTTIALFSCKKEIFIPDEEKNIEGTVSHANGFPANYDIVFNQEKVNRLNIIFTAQEWQDMQTDLSKKRGGGRPGGLPSETPDYFECQVNFNGLTWKFTWHSK